ncbi:hypothetical protein [Nocardia sp. NPDC005978]|uniref:hypothetical protein n=1 Tax=unclassified Nocardia TaxID=2637762 RepID=UPI0033B51535
MKLRSLLHRKTKTVPILPAEARAGAPQRHGRLGRSKTNGALEEQLERLLTPSELDIVQHHRI